MDAKLEPKHPVSSTEGEVGAFDSDFANFYVHKDGETYGPESATNLRALYAEGWLQPGDLIWREGQPEWQTAEVAFASSFQELAGPHFASLEEAGFFDASAVRLSAERKWPWGSLGIAIVAHVILFCLVIALFQLHPIKFTAYTVPVSKDPPMEVAMVTEPEPPPPPPPEPTPPPPDPAPPTPPPVPELPPPPPAPPVMAIPTPPPPPPVPIEPVVPENLAPPAPAPIPVVEHHKTLKPKVREIAQVAPEAPPPAPVNEGEPEYLSDPKPDYPFVARQRREQGTVLLLVNLDEAGNPTSVSVEQSSGYSVLDKAAQKQVLTLWRFKPGQGSTVHVPVRFQLED